LDYKVLNRKHLKKIKMENFVYINKFSLPHPLCDEIIEMFEKNAKKHIDGITGLGLNKNVKDTREILIPSSSNSSNIDIYTNRWIKIYNFLIEELKKNLAIYSTKDESKFLEKTEKNIYTIQIQKYEKNKGKYIWHNDQRIEKNNSRHRIITFLWYLNDVAEGGDTGFLSYTVKPEKGKLLLFPADWSYPHCGNMPISNDKYIMTGWIYRNM